MLSILRFSITRTNMVIRLTIFFRCISYLWKHTQKPSHIFIGLYSRPSLYRISPDIGQILLCPFR